MKDMPMSELKRKKRAIILFNLGGPDGPDAVKPFLFNLFNDPAIISLPNPFRYFLAKLISSRRAPIAREIYNHIGGKSPLLELTKDQADALETALNGLDDGYENRCFIAMRYWKPFADESAAAVKAWGADEQILLPLYPQFSTTTSGSSVKDWKRACHKVGLAAPIKTACCYPTNPGFIDASAEMVKAGYENALKKAADLGVGKPRLLFSAHGVPKAVITKRADPYQSQIEKSAQAVVDKMAIADLDWLVCYQSRVGPMEWIGPSTEHEIERAGKDGVPLVIVPIAFVTEHSETLVELDIEYREIADELKIPVYERVRTVCSHPLFISGLVDVVNETQQELDQNGPDDYAVETRGWWCPDEHSCAVAKQPMGAGPA
ncbi:ferrochelatase [Thalassospira xiamenensis]|jgi:ferrochelatase|uniref:Ferrochelatase n=3 Tax=Thalassospiraceae TaxID=2844866 RepID=A0ABR5XYY2_9PROT|nr:Protoheme ferro-lyase [Thalassospira xiamenensis M-5 = DSM 17429]KZD01730.1 ferrochelatase [Thalassospira xiamenensis]MAB32626.1 ferrochelatase [Thalassospira sp.]OHY99944.1 ferrochelatase [Thalassospira sp. MIT1004]KZD11213.1 ferrochelatase [Thalassospira xiamenensis]|tara:strand:+ start:3802 stop:4929 length:1128 start_codon:yes stop_codon:yes gene_type:complete